MENKELNEFIKSNFYLAIMVQFPSIKACFDYLLKII